MIRASLPLLLAALFTSVSAHTQAFSRLSFQDGQDTTAAGLRLQLHEPDNPAAPTLWQGPLSIADSSAPCKVDASLIRDVFLSQTGKLVIVVSISGSDTFVGFFDPHTCARKWPPLKAFTRGAVVDGARLTLLPACACEVQGKPCSCSAAAIYRLRDNVPPLRLAAASRALTRQTFGVAFNGSRTFAHPPTSLAPAR